MISIHMIKNMPYSNPNRDEVGAPKIGRFGNVERARISSQCLKRSWRTSEILKEELGERALGIRTKKLPDLVGAELEKRGISAEMIEAVKTKLTGFGNKDGKEAKDEKLETSQIVFYTPEDIQAVADEMEARLSKVKDAKEIKKWDAKEIQSFMKENNKRGVTLDMALFGRMVTSDAFADVEASMQVAHAMGTNKAYVESDFFTAVDDLIASSEEKGSSHLGTADYTSSCYYIYATIDTGRLRENLGSDKEADEIIKKAVPVLIKIMAETSPTGKTSSTAPQVLPSAILVECKNTNTPVSYANAFETPIEPNEEGGLVFNSVKALRDECCKIQEAYELPVTKRIWFTTEDVEMPEAKKDGVAKTVNTKKLSALMKEIVF